MKQFINTFIITNEVEEDSINIKDIKSTRRDHCTVKTTNRALFMGLEVHFS